MPSLEDRMNAAIETEFVTSKVIQNFIHFLICNAKEILLFHKIDCKFQFVKESRPIMEAYCIKNLKGTFFYEFNLDEDSRYYSVRVYKS